MVHPPTAPCSCLPIGPVTPPPAGLAADLSAQIVFRYLDAGTNLHGAAEAVSNNHFDQDGLVALFALVRPEEAFRRRELLEDLAAAGDFATYRDRRSARLAMAAGAFWDPASSPLALEREYADRVAQVYEELLGRLGEWCDKPDLARHWWADEDASLRADEDSISRGAVQIRSRSEVDLAVLDVPEGAGGGGRGLPTRTASDSTRWRWRMPPLTSRSSSVKGAVTASVTGTRRGLPTAPVGRTPAGTSTPSPSN